MDKNKEKIKDKFSRFLTVYFRVFLFFVVTVFSLFSGIFVLLPKYRDVREMIDETKKNAESDFFEKEKFLTILKKANDEFKEIDNYDLTKLNMMLPASLTMADAIGILSAISDRTGFILKDVKCLDEENEEKIQGNINSMSLTAAISGGDYNDLKSFLFMAANNVSIIDITSITFREQGSYDLELKAYYRGKDIENVAEFAGLDKKIFSRKSFLDLKKYTEDAIVESKEALLEDNLIPPPIKNLVISDPGLGDRLNLIWENQPSKITSKIKIYRFDGNEGAGKLIAQLPKDAAAFVDKGLASGMEYYYLARAATDSAESGNNKRYKGIPANVIPPSIPSEIKVSPMDKDIEISWKNPPDSDLAYIYVHKSLEKFSIGSLTAKIAAVTDKRQSWTDKDVENFVEYYYTLVAEDTAGNRSADKVIRVGNTELFSVKEEN